MTEYSSLKEAFDAKQREYDLKKRRIEKSMESIIDLTEADRMQRQYDMLAEQRRQERPNATHSLMESTTVNRETTPFISIVDERTSKGLGDDPTIDQYDKHNPEPDADAMLEATGATITYSSVTIGNDTYVKRPIKGIF